MIRGFQRLQICNFWMHRTKDMNLLMWQMSLNQFENEFKLTTETMEYYCIIGFYSSLAFQRHKVCKFWIYGLKDMNFQRSKHFLFLKSNSNSVKTGGCHVASSDWTIPIQADYDCKLSD
jgi:hypothetical protein